MLKKYVIKLSNTLHTINYLKASQKSQDECSCSDYPAGCINGSCYAHGEFNRNLFIENYCIGLRGDLRSSEDSKCKEFSEEFAREARDAKEARIARKLRRRESRAEIDRNNNEILDQNLPEEAPLDVRGERLAFCVLVFEKA